MRNSREKPRCPDCLMARELCICALAPRLALSTRVGLIMHVSERSRTSNTGRLVPLALRNSCVRLRGDRSGPTDASGLVPPGYRGLVLYPSADSLPLDGALAKSIPRPVVLIALDGSWSQAARMARREPALRGLLRVSLPPGPPSSYRLRTQSDPARVCTFEAVARALGVLEGAEARKRLEVFFDMMVGRMLWSRGKLKASEVIGGVPPEAQAGSGRGRA